MKSLRRVVLDPFCFRQFDPKNSSFISYDKQKFEERINELYSPEKLVDGYAPFCKHIIVENFTEAVLSVAPITKENQHLLRTCYEARTEQQLPVLRRFFPKQSTTTQKALYLNIILYSKEQVQKENAAMGKTDPNKDVDYEYGIISVKPAPSTEDTPMDPITCMRNALGVEQGGSGVKLDRDKYMKSVKYWEKYAIIK